MADEPEPPTHGGVIFDPEDPAPPQGIYSINTLTPAQLAALRSRIREARTKLRMKGETRKFARAVLWVYNVFSYDVHLDSAFVPLPSYGSTFDDFVGFIYRKEKDAEAEGIVEGEVQQE